MEKYEVTGMSCAACSTRVEKAVSAVPGVTACAVNLLTNSMGVEGSASDAAIIRAVEEAGYGASRMGTNQTDTAKEEALADRDTPVLRRRLIASLGFLLFLMYLSMGHMLGLPMPAFLHGNPLASGILQMLLAGIVMVINQKFFISGFRGLLHRAPNMDTLVALGSGVSFLWSVWVLIRSSEAYLTGTAAAGDLYFESAAMIVTLITVGKLLEARSKGRTTDALRSLMQLAPETATVIRDGQELVIPAEQVHPGDVFAVRPGERIPVDGIVLEGQSAVNEAALTGESIPADKAPGDAVSAATINQSGYLRCEATRVGEDTALAQIIRMVSDAAATKAPIAKLADRVSGIFVPAVIGIALVTLVIWLLAGQTAGFALARAISVLVISCPCALGLATPVSIMVGSGVGAKNGILFKTAVSLEQAGKAQIAVLDKTGTITTGEPQVTDVFPAKDAGALLRTAAALEQKSEHPLAGAVLQYAKSQGIAPEEVTDFRVLPGNGLTAVLDGEQIAGGNLRFIQSMTGISGEAQAQADALAQEGKTPLFFAGDGELLGIIAVADTVREDSPAAVKRLRDMGIRVVMLTGDNERTAAAIGQQAGVDRVIAGVLPDGKESVIRQLQAAGKVIMIGDGINDAPALTRADTGMAIGAGTDVALDAADVVLMKSRLSDAAAAIALSRGVLRNIRENLFWAFIYNIIGIPLAAGAYIAAFGWELNPMFGAAAMSLSSFCVVSNALRLNLLNIRDARRDRALRSPVSLPEIDLPQPAAKTLTLHVGGMMCPHCEARVKKALEALPEVVSADVSHTAGTAELTLHADASPDVLQKAVEDAGYTLESGNG